MNNITIELSKEDRKLLEGLMGSVTLLASVIGSAHPKEAQEKIIKEVTEAFTPAANVPDEQPVADPVEMGGEIEGQISLFDKPTPVAETAPEVKPVSLAEFQKAVTLAVSKGADAKKATKEIINKYAASVSAVPEGKRAEVMAELANI